ncbi:hypothetical protein LTS15_011284 [Exophiala xenobiotica]|nr:hypothetical protein LTS15_011284 [Exophiala xenobiotica]
MDSQQCPALRQDHAEDCAADHSSPIDEPSFPHISASEDAKERYKFELQELVTYLRKLPYHHWDADDRITEFFLPAEQYQQFEELARCGEFAGAHLKYDYSYASETLALRMASIKHEIIVEHLKRRLISFIDRAENNTESSMAEFAASLIPTGSAQVRYPSKDGKGNIERRPDLTIRTEKNPEYPVLVGEVALSQTTQELQKLAQEYIEQTEGNIRTVITIDLDYPTGKGAYLLVWRANFGEDGKFKGVACDDAVEIRNKDGGKNPNRQAGLFLSLQDFAFIPGVDKDADLQSVAPIGTVSTDDLYAALERAEKVRQSLIQRG